ncbi:site-specific integrase [Pseudarthrobacter sp. AL07]|uniref:tyrosine-type recombinase/integrase n=1 Tax=unclassified Pseudarthrobacter TaxID=2647000 RepID=UPI00249CB43E|nr:MULTISPECIES: site-specific integrase [unclassified Pseudarthrobacter]MDI3194248.1 site-specific integrase [Pseudarthrobacter sp. AL20]MDI3208314.1 site-specific integrase [Pseudarthrobacter sp. AL07]
MAINKLSSGTKRWQVDWTTADGNRRRKRFVTKREAEDFWHTTVRSVQGGTYIDPRAATKLTVAKLYEDWIARITSMGANGRKPASPKTADNYRRCYENYVAPRWGQTPISKVRYDDVAAWIVTLRGRDGQPAGMTTRREVALYFGRLMGHAVKKRLLAANPAKDPLGQTDYVPARVTQRDHVYLTMPQLTALANACGEFELFVMVAGTCGLRWGEITALTYEDVDLGDKPAMAVSKAYSEVGGHLVLGPTKGGESRVVPLPALVAQRLKRSSSTSSASTRVFSGARGTVLRNSTWTRRHYSPAIADMRAAASNFPRPTFHDLRHTAVSLAVSSGANIKVIQRIAGHASATMTLDTYAGLFDHDLHDSAGRLNTALAQLGWK